MNSSNYITPFWVQNVTSSTINVTIKKNNASAPTVDVYYSNDLSTWTLLGQTSTITLSLNVAAGNKVYFRSNADQWADTSSTFYYNYFSSTGNCNIGGNIMSLLYGSNFTGYEKVFPNENCYGIFNGLFVGWTNLVDAGELVLPVTHIESRTGAMGNRCYRALLNGCSNLINGPHVDLRFRDNPESDELYACMQRFIAGCPKLETIHINTQNLNGAFTDIFLSTNYNGLTWYDYSGNPRTVWPTNVTCVNVISMYIGYDRVIDWYSSVSGEIIQVDDNSVTPYVTIYKKSRDAKYYEPFYLFNNTNNTLTFNWTPSRMNSTIQPTVNISYSFDNSTYTSTSVQGSTVFTVNVPANTKCYLKADMTFEKTGSGTFQWSSEIGGNIASLLYGNNFTGDESYYPTYYDDVYEENFNYERICAYMFSGSDITDASNLVLLHDNPSLNGSVECNGYMFRNCTSLVSAPALPIILTDSCYTHMFAGCTSLATAPILSATTLTSHCYDNMFAGCTSLVNVQNTLPATTPEYSCYYGMFNGCTSLTTAPEIMLTSTWRQGGGYIYNSCGTMFYGCTSLNEIKVHFEDWPPTTGNYYNTSNWVYGVAANGTFYKPNSLPNERGYDRIPNDWTITNF